MKRKNCYVMPQSVIPSFISLYWEVFFLQNQSYHHNHHCSYQIQLQSFSITFLTFKIAQFTRYQLQRFHIPAVTIIDIFVPTASNKPCVHCGVLECNLDTLEACCIRNWRVYFGQILVVHVFRVRRARHILGDAVLPTGVAFTHWAVKVGIWSWDQIKKKTFVLA